MKYMKLFTWILFSLIAGIAGCSSDHGYAAKPPEIVHGVSQIQIQEQAMSDVFEAVGTVRAARVVAVSAEIAGRVTSIPVREGDKVKSGEVIAVIEDLQPRAGLEQAQAALNAAEHEMAAAESDRALAQATFSRMNSLYEKKSLSPHEFDEANARVQSATARRDAAVANHTQAAATVQQARIVLGRSRVRAPFAGIVTERRVDPGTFASPGMQLLTVESAGNYRLEATVNEHDLRYVQLGTDVPVALDSQDGPPMHGKVIQIIPAADPASRSFVIKVELPAVKNLRSGLFGHAEFSRGQKRAIVLPQAAVLARGQLQGVYVIGDNNVAGLRYITTGKARGDQVEILSGLASGERIAFDSNGRDLAGKRVEVQ